jgi:hypothetical protein
MAASIAGTPLSPPFYHRLFYPTDLHPFKACTLTASRLKAKQVSCSMSPRISSIAIES